MENSINIKRRTIVDEAYRKYREMLVVYVNKRIHDMEDSEDIVQDAFIKILNIEDMICETTVKSLVFTAVQNLLVDRLRRRVRKSKAYSYLYDCSAHSVESTEQKINAKNILSIECLRMNALPPACRKIYYMNRFKDMTADEIAQELSLSRRTVEAQIFKGRKRVRTYLKAVGAM